MKNRLLIWLVPRLIKLIFLFLVNTIRWKILGRPFSQDNPQRYVHAFWHARLLMMPRISRHVWHGYMLISSHRDGGFIADTLHLLDIDTIRGSTTRGGARAMLRMLRAVKEENRHLGITPDGPKGPPEVVQKGTVQLAMKAGLPIVPVCYATKAHWRINSWDKFYIPKPFTRGVLVMGEEIVIAKDDDLDAAIARTQQGMDAAQQLADHYFD